jgi:16S rRNA processing protein RimM
MVTVGRIVRPHGNRGEVVVASETDFAEERFRAGASVYMTRDGRPAALVVRGSRPQAGRRIVGFEGIGTITEAEALRSAELRIAPDALRPLGAGAYYVHDLVGCEVRTMSGERIGEVARVEMATGVPTLVVGMDDVLIPFTEAICRRIDPAGRVIEIDPPEGLIELNRPAGPR